MNTVDKYKKRQDKYKHMAKKQEKTSNILSLLRFVVFFSGAGISIYLYLHKDYYIMTSVLLSAIIIFSYLIYLHNKTKRSKNFFTVMAEINGDCISRIEGKWNTFKDTGKEFIDKNHSYSYDLDIFGQNSLFQWLNTASTYIGRQKLKNAITSKPESIKLVYDRQEASRELSKRLYERQKLIAEGVLAKDKFSDPEKLIEWFENDNTPKMNPVFIFIARLLPVLTVLSITFSALRIISYAYPSLMILINIIVLAVGSSKRSEAFSMAEKYAEDIIAYKNMLKIIEKQYYKSSYLAGIKSKLFLNCKISPSNSIGKLSKIASFIAGRRNLYYAILDMIFLLDYDLYISMENWKSKYGKSIRTFVDSVGEFEYISSIAGVMYDHPDWTLPKFTSSELELVAKKMGHPLLSNARVCNDVTIKNPDIVLLITGSNMSGKSTLLRTCGINLVLAYAGAPVCAENLTCSIMSIYSCMRTSDDLERSISSFYAEILKIKNIVNASKSGEKVFFLLDEIFKGTNSIDRHTGASVLIKQLADAGNIGLVSTHDLELSSLEDEPGSKVKNYHFEEYYKNNEIHFDYKLKMGVSTTRNAIYLMKLAGIKI